jgi:hypothetical protein
MEVIIKGAGALLFVLYARNYYGDNIKKDEIGGTCSMHEKIKYTPNLNPEPLVKTPHER